MSDFVHLHVHSHYSLLDGAVRIKDMVSRTSELGAGAVALTDHGNLFGAIDFYTTAKKAGIKPILGMEAYISPTTRQDRSMGGIQTAAYHLVLLAMNETGWRNLIKLSSRAYVEGFYYRPRIDRQLLDQYNEGLICTTACLKGEIPSALLAGNTDKARRIAKEYLDIFGRERFFIEVQSQGIAEQEQVNPHLAELAGELGVGLVGTNDVHFLHRGAKDAHEVLTCISTGKTLSEDGGQSAYTPELYLKSPEEMAEALKDYPRAVANTARIAEMCNVELDFTAKHLPRYYPPDDISPRDYLRKIAHEGLREKFGRDVSQEYVERLDKELEVIEQKQYSSYFLIVHDFVQFARDRGIPCGARGSGCATLLGYCLDISNVDPIRYGLLFERFTDPAREEDPDIDIDICQEGRADVLQYVREKYGHVAQIITYGTLKARAVLRDVGRVMDIPLQQVDAIAKKVPEGPGVTLQGALVGEPDLRKLHESDEQVRRMIDHGLELEGLARHSGVHAAGVVVADTPLEELVPLCKQSDSDELITQWDGPTCEKVGLMKMDFLGLRTLTILQRARELVRRRTGKDIDPEKLTLDDPEVFRLFCEARTDGVFQFESDGMKNVLVQMQPSRIEDLIAANAMFRPGPMDLIPSYCARKNGSEAVPSVHPLVDDILAETHGIMCYQEQVMLVLNRLGKLPLNTALTLIKAISKKKEHIIEKQRPDFIDGAKENGIDHDEAERLFELILKFAGYGFNKAHSTRYSVVAYQTAFFKAHYPREFMAALLTFESGDTDKVVQYLAEAKRMGVEVDRPDINTCEADFSVDGEVVRFGLAAVKGVGNRAVDEIVRARREGENFTDLYHFCRQVDLRTVNRTAIEALIKCGAFDSLGAHRAAMTAAVEEAIHLGHSHQEDLRSGQMNMFDMTGGGSEPPPARFPDVEPWSEAQLLAAEKDTLGFYVTAHPLARYGRELTSLSTPPGIALGRLKDNPVAGKVTVGCTIASVRPRVTRSGRSAGKKMARLTVEDLTGRCEAIVFANTFEKVHPLLEEDSIVFIRGTADYRQDRPCIIVDEVIPIDEALGRLTAKVLLRLPPGGPDKLMDNIKEVLRRHRGDREVQLELTPPSKPGVRLRARADRKWRVNPTRELMDELTELLGEENLMPCPANGGSGNGNSNHRYKNGRRGGGKSSAKTRRPAAATNK